MLRELLERGAFKFGTPWRLYSDSISIVVPILGGYERRNYVTAQEVIGALKVKDTGFISAVEIISKSDKPVFVRQGTILKGKWTQSRAIEVSVVVEPERGKIIWDKIIALKGGAKVRVPVCCVHASQPIWYGRKFSFAGITPAKVQSRLMEGNAQWRVWRAVEFFARNWRVSSDNLVKVMRARERKIKEIIKKVPLFEEQVGIVLLDINGVYALTCFDHKDSWMALRKEIVSAYGENIVERCKKDLFQVNEEAVKTCIKEFVEELVRARRKVVAKGEKFKTYKLEGKEVIGELTEFDGREIHLIAFRREPGTPLQQLRRDINPALKE